MKDRALRRHHRDRVICKKKKFIKLANNYWHYAHEGSLNKGKIHCSCMMCRYSSTHKELIRKKKRLRSLEYKEQILGV